MKATEAFRLPPSGTPLNTTCGSVDGTGVGSFSIWICDVPPSIITITV
jgi:hypothetical protein